MSCRGSLQTHVLALNRSYLAIQVISARRAFCLLWKGHAEVVNVEDGAYLVYDFEGWRSVCELRVELGDLNRGGEDWIQAVSFPIQVPRVVRLLKFDRMPRNGVKFSRRNVFLRDEHRCQYCCQRFSTHQLSLDHVVPRRLGGPTTWENVVCACRRCNVRKGGRTPQQAGMKLNRPPAKPKRNPLFAHQTRHEKYECWSKFLN